jgi:hypothetical protein
VTVDLIVQPLKSENTQYGCTLHDVYAMHLRGLTTELCETSK